MIARAEPYCLFLDELNACSHEVQKAFYSLILDRRLGSYTLHPESVVIGAGNRSQDSAIVRPMPRVDPVIRATLPSSLMLRDSCRRCSCRPYSCRPYSWRHPGGQRKRGANP